MLDETKELIEKAFKREHIVGGDYEMWYSKDYLMAISKDKYNGKVEFCLDYQNAYADKDWISEEDGLRRIKLMAFW